MTRKLHGGSRGSWIKWCGRGAFVRWGLSAAQRHSGTHGNGLQSACVLAVRFRHVAFRGLPAVLAELLTLQHRETTKHAAAALMGLAVEKESKVLVMLHAGVALVRLMRGQVREGRSGEQAVAAGAGRCPQLERRG